MNEQKKNTSGDKTGIQSVKCRDKFSGKYIYDSFSIYEAKKKKIFRGCFIYVFIVKWMKKINLIEKNGETVFFS